MGVELATHAGEPPLSVPVSPEPSETPAKPAGAPTGPPPLSVPVPPEAPRPQNEPGPTESPLSVPTSEHA